MKKNAVIDGAELLLATLATICARFEVDQPTFRGCVAEAVDLLTSAKAGRVEAVNVILDCSTEVEGALKIAEMKLDSN